ncbi:hypothetical protein MNBD_GAMMA03-237 [hydrothermal vent metagenome]|uniref:Uncharacterized protein n=1 Tax=hydrothermal vent metagenome TaxID=652676 RepID=A0A3B0VQG0_9ZZZZ
MYAIRKYNIAMNLNPQIEDITAVLDSRPNIVLEVLQSGKQLRTALSQRFT